MIENLFELMESFEKRNGLKIKVELHSDKSGVIKDFWAEDIVYAAETITHLENFLIHTKLEIDEEGCCIRPFKILNQK